jgi:serine/threonine protein kinase
MMGRFGGYEIAGIVGHGGMGIVLKGFESPLNRYVAIKVLSPLLASSGPARKRFAREAQAAAAVVHENVIAIHRVDEDSGLPYLVMPYVLGESLQCRIDNEGPLSVVAVLRIAQQIAAGLAAAHAQGLVHRDIKPANILLGQGIDRVTITDFGLARAVDDGQMTGTGILAGTPQYMSPEQARGDTIDSRSDLFSLGSLMYAMSVGYPPFRADNSYTVLRRIMDETPRDIREFNPDVPEWLCRIVERLLAKTPSERFQSAEELATILEQGLAHLQQPTAFALPIECQSIVVDSDNDRRHHSPKARTDSWKWQSSLVVMVISAIAISGLALWPSRKAGETGDVSPSGSQSAATSGVDPSSSPRVSAPRLGWDESAIDIVSLEFALDSFESLAARDWDRFPEASSELGNLQSE